MFNTAPSPKTYTSPHPHNSHRHSPRPQANTRSPRLRSSKPSSRPGSPHVNSTHPYPPPPQESSSGQSPQQYRNVQYTEQGTQYSPPDWPPTDPRSSLRQQNLTLPNIATSHISSNMVPVAVPSTMESQFPVEHKVSYMNAEEAARLGAGPGAGTEAVAGVGAGATAAATASPTFRRTHADMSQSPTRARSPSSNSVMQDSRLKRPRPTEALPFNPNARVVPRNYAECDPRLLSALISSMLMELMKFNDALPVNNDKLTRFHSRAPPNISVHDYLLRLTHHATLIPPILLAMVFYIDRLCLLYPEFTINSLTVHRFLITAGTVASKGLSDSFWTNNTYARVGGVTVKELALLELEFLQRMNWRIVPWQNKILQDYYESLVHRDINFRLEEKKSGEESEEDDDDSMSSHSSDALDDDVIPARTQDVNMAGA